MTRGRRGPADLPPGPATELVSLLRQLQSLKPRTLKQISAASGIAIGHVSEVLNGWKAPSPDAAEALATALGADDRTAAKARDLADDLAELNRYTRAKQRGTAPAGTSAEARPAGVPEARFDVPPPPSRFIGREAEVAAMQAAIHGSKTLHRAPVVQIFGPVGIGKTALASIVAHELRPEYPDGCVFVDFGLLGDVSAAHARLLSRFGFTADMLPAEPAELRALYLSYLYRRSVLIVADNVVAPEQVLALVPASPSCAVVTTGRRFLDHIDEVCAIDLGPLTDDESQALLTVLIGATNAETVEAASSSAGVPAAIRATAAGLRGPGHGPREPVKPPEPAETGAAEARLLPFPPAGLSMEPIPDTITYLTPLRRSRSAGVRNIGIVTGYLRRVHDVDIWVNSENTDMRMSRFDDYTISAIIRYDGAVRDAAGRVIEDTIADELALKAGQGPVAAGTAILTGSGALAASHNVRAIVHVAAVYGEPGAGYRQVRDVGRCVTGALAEIDRSLERPREVSVLFPMLGTGQGGGSIERTAAVLVGTAAEYLASVPVTRIGTVWFLAHVHRELTALHAAVDAHPLLKGG
ncbi:O-acetyl-ADP-ribose deacetylase (regulator of RNase III)/transcriptional regulator with XRE-family HTH domain [Catenulispora sp. MAP5-51]